MMDTIKFDLISLVVSKGLDMHLMGIVTIYLFGSSNTNIYMKIHKGFSLPKAYKLKNCNYVFN